MPPRPDDTETDAPDAETDSPADAETDSPADAETDSPADAEVDGPADRDQPAQRGAMAAVEMAHALEPFAAIEVGDGQVIVYDTENQQAWIQSGAAVALDAVL